MSTDDARRAAYRWLIGFTALVALVTFTLSFHGLDGYGRHLAGIPWQLAWLVPVGVDGLTLCGVAATFLLRHAHRRARAYAWLVFAVAVALSVAGNVLDAAARNLPTAGLAGSAAWPILLALASHLVVVARRAMDRTATAETTVNEPVAAGQDVEPATERATVEPKVYARRLAGRGKAGTDIALALQDLGHDVTPRQVQRWTKDIRERRINGSAVPDLVTTGEDR